MNITVYLGSNEGRDPALKQAAKELGAWIGSHGHTLIYGGSKCGLMGILAESVLLSGGKVIGVEPEFFVSAGLIYEAIDQLIVTPDMTERKAKMIDLGDAFIAFPGGTGTLEEISAMGVKKNGTVMFSLKASVDSDDGATELRAGYSANAEFITAQADSVISIEETAISFEDGATYVYKLVSGSARNQKFERVPVVTGLSDGIYIELKEGVTKDMVLRGNKMN